MRTEARTGETKKRRKEDAAVAPPPLALRAVPKGILKSLVSQLGLTRRETEVVHLLCEGMTELDIAESIGLSPHTVHAYTAHAYVKLGVHSRQELATRLIYTCLGRDENAESVPA